METLVFDTNLLREARGKPLWQLLDLVFDSGVAPGMFSGNRLSLSREGSQNQHVFGPLVMCLDVGAELDWWWKAGQQIEVGSWSSTWLSLKSAWSDSCSVGVVSQQRGTSGHRSSPPWVGVSPRSKPSSSLCHGMT